MKLRRSQSWKWAKIGAALLVPTVLGLIAANLNSWRVQRFSTARGQAFQVAFSPDGRFVAAADGGDEAAISVWNVVTPNVLRAPRAVARRTLKAEYPTSICFSGDGRRLICTASNIVQWEVGTWRRLRVTPHENSTAKHLEPRGDSFSYYTGEKVETHRQNTGRKQSAIAVQPKNPDQEWNGEVAFSPDGATIAIAVTIQLSNSVLDAIRLRDTHTKRTRLLRLGYCGIGNCELSAPTFSPDSRFLLVARSYQPPDQSSQSYAATLWDVTTRKIALTWKETDWVNAYAFSPDGQILAAAYEDGTIALRQARTGRLLQNVKAHRNAAKSVAFSPDGRTLASCGFDGTLALLRVR